MTPDQRLQTAPQETKKPERPPFMELLRQRWRNERFVCVGLDSDRNELPNVLGIDPNTKAGRQFTDLEKQTIAVFNERIIDATYDLAAAYKPNLAFYLEGNALDVLARTVRYIQTRHPEIPVILDAKFGDIGNTAKKYARYTFDELEADAVTINPYMGKDAADPFLKYKNKGVIPIVRTSNKGAEETQNVVVKTPEGEIPYYLFMAKIIARGWNGNGNIMIVAGATNPQELGEIRKAVGDIPLLVPGVGAQGGSASEVVEKGIDSRKQGILVNSSRAILFASRGLDYAEAARAETLRLNNEINIQVAKEIAK